MNSTLKQQIEAIQKARTSISLLRDLADLQNGPPLETVRKEWEETIQNVYNILNEIEDSEALNDAGSTIAALNLSDPYKEIERLKAEKSELEKALSHYADVNQNQ